MSAQNENDRNRDLSPRNILLASTLAAASALTGNLVVAQAQHKRPRARGRAMAPKLQRFPAVRQDGEFHGQRRDGEDHNGESEQELTEMAVRYEAKGKTGRRLASNGLLLKNEANATSPTPYQGRYFAL